MIQYEIEQFLYHEAELIDDRRFDAWIELFADDLHYWVPVRSVRSIRQVAEAYSGPGEVAHFDETKKQLRQRTDRLATGVAWSDEPASQTRHLITNVRVRETTVSGEYLVRSLFLVHQNRLERDVDLFAGERKDLLRRDGDGWLIARRHVFLDQAVVLAKAITTFF